MQVFMNSANNCPSLHLVAIRVLDGIHAHDDEMMDCTCNHAMEDILGLGLLQADIKLS